MNDATKDLWMKGQMKNAWTTWTLYTPPIQITDEMIERAAKSLYETRNNEFLWPPADKQDKEWFIEHALNALHAALGGSDG